MNIGPNLVFASTGGPISWLYNICLSPKTITLGEPKTAGGRRHVLKVDL